MLQSVVAMLLAMSFFLLAGCGYKNFPVPPESVVPTPIGDLDYKLTSNGVQLSWSFPIKTIKGSLIEDIYSFELYRAEVALNDYCGSCPIPFGEPIEIDGGSPFDGKIRKKAAHGFSILRPGHKYFFKVRSRTNWWVASDDSNIITFVWFLPAAAPEGLTIIEGDHQLSLSWRPVTSFPAGSPAEMEARYQLLRSIDGNNFTQIGEPISTTDYVDRQVRNGQRYFYAVQTIMVYRSELVNGGISQEVAASPIDLTPPLTPTGVIAVRSDAGIKILWDRPDEADIAGYQIYRRNADQEDYDFLAKVQSGETVFVDSSAGDTRYYYVVTAIDKAIPPNESHMSSEVTLRH